MPVYDSVDMLDVTGPYEMFRWAKIDADVVAEKWGRRNSVTPSPFKWTRHSSRPGTSMTRFGCPAAIRLCSPIINANGAYLNFLRDQAKNARYVCSVCEGAMLLAGAGLLDGYKATTHWYFIPCFEKYFKNVTVAEGYPRFWLDRNRLTGGGISSGLDEALKLIMLLTDEQTAIDVQQNTQYYPKPPVSSDIPSDAKCILELDRPPR